jgi:competence protein ComFB
MTTIDFSDLHNYFQPLVYQYLLESVAVKEKLDDEELLKDIACLALNLLPARYVRHDVDMAFFLTSKDRLAIQNAVVEAVDEALKRIVHSNRKAQEIS